MIHTKFHGHKLSSNVALRLAIAKGNHAKFFPKKMLSKPGKTSRKTLIIRNIGKNAIIVDGAVLQKGESINLQKESEVIMGGGEPMIISNYEHIISLPKTEGFAENGTSPAGAPGMSLKECLLGFYKFRKVADQRKEQAPIH